MKQNTLRIAVLSLLLTLAMLALFACTPAGMKDNTSAPAATSSAAPESDGKASTGAENADVPAPAEGLLIVHFLDVGQGDSIFIELPGGKTMLIDASEYTYADKIISYIQGRGHDRIDVLVATHPHSDHIGGMQYIVTAFDIGDIYMPRAVNNTKTFENLLAAIEKKNLSVHTARAGVSVSADETVTIDIIAPVSEEYESLNNYSAVIKLVYGKTSFLFTGDAETLSEEEITANVSVDVLKVGHHGSRTSTGAAFLSRVSPRYAVISVGEGNDYGHPTETVLKRLADQNIEVFRTDLDGTVVISSDGTTLSIALEKETITPEATETMAEAMTTSPNTETGTSTDARWVLNTNTKKIHYPSCASAEQITEQNRATSNSTVAELEAQGYSPCGACRPHD